MIWSRACLEHAITGLVQFKRGCLPNICLLGHFGPANICIYWREIFLCFPSFCKTLCALKFYRIDNIKQRAFYECLRLGQNGCQTLSWDSWEQEELPLQGGQCSKIHVPIDETQRVILVVFFVILLYYCRHSCQSRKEYYHFLGGKTKGKNTDCKWKPAELTTLAKINWVIVMNANLLSNRKPKQRGETFSLPGWKTSIIKKC